MDPLPMMDSLHVFKALHATSQTYKTWALRRECVHAEGVMQGDEALMNAGDAAGDATGDATGSNEPRMKKDKTKRGEPCVHAEDVMQDGADYNVMRRA